MKSFAGASFAAAVSFASLAFPAGLAAAELPAVKSSPGNAVPECATPGRMMTFLTSRNAKLDPRYQSIATEYMRHGEELGLRWDYAFFQMLLETGNLTYTGDVKPEQNNFAGLGATGRGARGESFPDISTGVRAHLQHLQMYSGERVEEPVAQRTRDVQDWGVLTKWQASIKGPMTFTHLARKWAPGSKGYSRDIGTVAGSFFDGPCKGDDPQPELVAEARQGRDGTAGLARAGDPAPQGKGAEIAKAAIAETREGADGSKSGLGAGELAKAAAATPLINREAASPQIKILNAPAAAPASPEPSAAELPSGVPKVETASLMSPGTANGAKPAEANATAKDSATAGAKAPAASNCRVWTASYGGSKAIIIKAANANTTNYTVLDVNEGSEKKEADAYITAYAKGGKTVGEFANPNQALDKAFELCPEG